MKRLKGLAFGYNILFYDFVEKYKNIITFKTLEILCFKSDIYNILLSLFYTWTGYMYGSFDYDY